MTWCDPTIRKTQWNATPNLIDKFRIFGGVLPLKLRDGAGHSFKQFRLRGTTLESDSSCFVGIAGVDFSSDVNFPERCFGQLQSLKSDDGVCA